MRCLYMVATEMKMRFIVLGLLLTSFLVFTSINMVQAQWDALSSGYAVTTDKHGQIVIIGESVTAWAGTTDDTIQIVEFVWHLPADPPYYEAVKWDENETIFVSYLTPEAPADAPQEIKDWAALRDGSGQPGHSPQVTVYYAKNDPKFPDAIGDWGVQALFHNHHTTPGHDTTKVMVRATSFEVVPEVPFGTIVILLSWCGILGFFALRRKHIPL